MPASCAQKTKCPPTPTGLSVSLGPHTLKMLALEQHITLTELEMKPPFSWAWNPSKYYALSPWVIATYK